MKIKTKEAITSRLQRQGNYIKYNIPDYSRIVIDYCKRLNEKRGQVLFGNGELLSVSEKNFGELIIDTDHPLFTSPQKLGKIIRENRVEGIKLLQRIFDCEREFKEKIDRELSKSYDKINPMNLFEAATDYGSLSLDRIVPRKTLEMNIGMCHPKLCEEKKEKLVSECLMKLFTPLNGKNYLRDIYLDLVYMAERKLDGLPYSIEYFIDKIGFLTKNDLTLGALEIPENVERIVSNMARNNPCLDFHFEQRGIYEAESRIRHEYRKIVSELTDRANKHGDPEIMENLCFFSGLAIEFDDNNRRIRSKTFKYFAKILTDNRLDLKSTPIEAFKG